MERVGLNNQAGFALLIFLIVLMGLGGIALTGFMQGIQKEVEVKKFKHNKRVLKEAKQALLQYAYNYPVDNPGRGPGRLPCPDTDNDGQPDPSFFCTVLGVPLVGRLPWADQDLNFYDARDASGERLWYAVSSNFANTGPATINSGTPGTITIHDQTGSVMYDGSVAGIAAVIIAPGAVTERNGVLQDRSIANLDNADDQVADDDPGIIGITNYLDIFGALDNADFINGSNVNGFILGPIDDDTASITVNDQLIVITAAEVIEMAEKATLQSYQQAINLYNSNILADFYPWLDDYATINLNIFDGDINTRIGRVPSIFANYFDNTIAQPSQSIISDIRLRITSPIVVNTFGITLTPPQETISTAASIVFSAAGDLTITPSAPGVTFVRYFWDEELAADGWLPCPVVTDSIRDCHQAIIAPGVPDSSIDPNEVTIQVVQVTYTNTLPNPGNFTRLFEGRAGTDPVYQAPTPADHAYVYFEYDEVVPDAIDVTYQYDPAYLNAFAPGPPTNINYSLGVAYYPVLPNWALAAQDNWHNSIQFGYSAGFQPGSGSACTPGGPVFCLTVNNSAGTVNNKIAVLVLASDFNFIDEAADGFANDLIDIFEAENAIQNDIFDARFPGGNDRILIMR